MFESFDPATRRGMFELATYVITLMLIVGVMWLAGVDTSYTDLFSFVAVFIGANVLDRDRRARADALRATFVDVLVRAARVDEEEGDDRPTDAGVRYIASKAHTTIKTFLKRTRGKIRLAGLIPVRYDQFGYLDSDYLAALRLLRKHLLYRGLRDYAMRGEDAYRPLPAERRAFNLVNKRIAQIEAKVARRSAVRQRRLSEPEEIERRSRENYARFLEEQRKNPRPPLT